MSMKKVGIIGGLGPETTANFYLELIRLAQASPNEGRPPVLIWSVPIPYEVERTCIVEGQGADAMRELLVEGAERLAQGGADFIVMACNSLHIFINDLRAAVDVPVLSIIEETTAYVLSKATSKVGLLGTSILVGSGMYQTELAKAGIECAIPSVANQKKLQEAIFATLNGKAGHATKELVDSVTKEFSEQGIEQVVLGCTDLHLFFPKVSGAVEFIDSMAVFVEATAGAMGYIPESDVLIHTNTAT